MMGVQTFGAELAGLDELASLYQGAAILLLDAEDIEGAISPLKAAIECGLDDAMLWLGIALLLRGLKGAEADSLLSAMGWLRIAEMCGVSAASEVLRRTCEALPPALVDEWRARPARLWAGIPIH